MSKFENDALGTRMKEYEDVTRFKLSRKTFILCRCDGNAFHTYTRGLERPFDQALIDDMDETAKYLCNKIQNVKFAYVQSDEISLLLHEEDQDTQPWFSNGIQKMSSIAASKATSKFNNLRLQRRVNMLFAHSFSTISAPVDELHRRAKEFVAGEKLAEFDARFWTLPSAIEVYNYFLWRQQDAEKNSISSCAQNLLGHKALEGKNGLVKKAMMLEKGFDWEKLDGGKKYGRFIEKVTYINDKPGKILTMKEDGYDDVVQYVHDGVVYPEFQPFPFLDKKTDVVRNRWEVVPMPRLIEDKDFLLSRIKTQE